MILIISVYFIIFAACLVATCKTQNTSGISDFFVSWVICLMWPITIPSALFIWLFMNVHLFLREKL